MESIELSALRKLSPVFGKFYFDEHSETMKDAGDHIWMKAYKQNTEHFLHVEDALERAREDMNIKQGLMSTQ